MRLRNRYLIIFSIFLILSLGLFLLKVYTYSYIPVLMYHSVCSTPKENSRLETDLESFKKQMEFLKRNYDIVRLEEIPLLIEKKKVLKNPIAITFDDGYKDNYLLVFPIIKKHNIPITIFLVINKIGGSKQLNWQEIEEMQNSGLVSFGSHTFTHPDLTSIEDIETLRKEIFGSKAVLEEKLNTKVEFFSYPKGIFNSKIKNLVKQAGYKFAVAASKTHGNDPSDFLAYKRIRISQRDKNLSIFWFKTTKLYNFLRRER
ncbi:MAG: polysaccharide deacetylase family protein [Candidatus Omnitrophica bacterium]|nr:polysaccharide deacetylase family protein [Candidatus Omnitrophota bacterium]